MTNLGSYCRAQTLAWLSGLEWICSLDLCSFSLFDKKASHQNFSRSKDGSGPCSGTVEAETEIRIGEIRTILKTLLEDERKKTNKSSLGQQPPQKK